MARAKPKRWLVMPAEFRIAAASRNRGTARIGNEFSPSTTRWVEKARPTPV
jgi:hypothetical protein